MLSSAITGKKTYCDSNMIQKGNATLLQRFLKDYFAADADRSKCLHATSSHELFRTHLFGNVIYHSFSHDNVSYRINGQNVNVMLELEIFCAFKGFLIFLRH